MNNTILAVYYKNRFIRSKEERRRHRAVNQLARK